MMVAMTSPPASSAAASEPAPVRRTVTTSRALAWRDGDAIERPERLATEEPMEIRAGGPGQDPASVAVTMRTPGHDFELAVGFLVGEGLIGARDDVATVKYCELPAGEPQLYNIVTVALTRPLEAGGAVQVVGPTQEARNLPLDPGLTALVGRGLEGPFEPRRVVLRHPTASSASSGWASRSVRKRAMQGTSKRQV